MPLVGSAEPIKEPSVCGIAGLVGPAAAEPGLAARMAQCLEHRGPDGHGVWAEGAIALAHRRLAVLGLGEAGAQPMRSVSGRYTMTYNGEIYNHVELREILARQGRSPSWRGGSDTETVLACLEAWGLEELLTRCIGMFAMAVYDRADSTVTLVRDRLGEKPLYWAQHGGSVAFASQPSALRLLPGLAPSIDPDAVAELLRHAHVPGLRTIHREISEVGPGTLLRIPLTSGSSGTPEARAWWSFDAVARSGLEDPVAGSDDAISDLAEETIQAAVRAQLVSDVPLGAFLSGGIDSSLVVATMRATTASAVRTFTIGFSESAYDESAHARAVAQHLGTDHTELIVTPEDALAVIPEIPRIYDEPFADSSQIPTLLVSRLARGTVTVALSGDGGDELFGGYRRYRTLERYARTPRALALTGAALLEVVGKRRAARTAAALGLGPAHVARRLLSEGVFAEELVPGADHDRIEQRFLERWARTRGLGGLTARSMALDTLGYLPDDILHKVDRAAMSIALETRVPLLDHRLVALAWRLPDRMKVRDGVGKWVLRQLLARHVPRHLFERPKAGFAVPLGAWLRGPLAPWADALLAPDALGDDGLLDVAAVGRLWRTHRSGRWDASRDLWPLLMFQAWRNA